MKLSLGVKTDPVEHRYSYEWLFDLMAENGAKYLQLGSFFEMYELEPEWFHRLKEKAEQRGVRIKSMFTSYRELGGFMYNDPSYERVAVLNSNKMLAIAGILGVDFAGTNMGAVFYDRKDYKPTGYAKSLENFKRMSRVAKEQGLRGMTTEPMSCLAEPPTLADECVDLMRKLDANHKANPDTVPYYFCADISHGYADVDRKLVEDNWSLFEVQIPWIAEFHFKNTDAIFNSTFGFNAEERKRGIVDLARFRKLIDANADRFPVPDVTGYLELNHVKHGRDYTDSSLHTVLTESLAALRDNFDFAD